MKLPISRITFGAMAHGGRGEVIDEQRRIRTIHAALDHGTTAIDTAPMYSFGASETWVGRAIKGRRDRVYVMTKVGLRWDDPRGRPLFEYTDEHGERRAMRKCSRADSIRWEVEQSLRRLG